MPQKEMEEAARNGRYPFASWKQRRYDLESGRSGVLTAIRDEKGDLTGFVRLSRDMTLQKRRKRSCSA